VTCVEVRELLPEFAVGVLPEADGLQVERHLQWCAGCRKEAAELGSAAATVAFALPQAPVPQGLGDRVVGRIRQAAGDPGSPRRMRTAIAAAVAALVAVAGLGWGSVMAGRAERFADRARQAEERQSDAIEKFQHILQGVVPGVELPEQETFLGQLAPASADGVGGGAVLELVSPTRIDFTFVIVNGLAPAGAGALPYRVSLSNANGEVLKAGRIEELDADGSAELFHQFGSRDLSGFTQVHVTDANGAVVLAGEIGQRPAPGA
jgi:Putative zinc-finger